VRQSLLARAADATASVLAEGLREARPVFFGHAEQVGDHQQGEGTGDLADEFALTAGEERIQDAIASRHMNAPFSLRRLGVISPISRAR
jgi:hypothetical protein